MPSTFSKLINSASSVNSVWNFVTQTATNSARKSTHRFYKAHEIRRKWKESQSRYCNQLVSQFLKSSYRKGRKCYLANAPYVNIALVTLQRCAVIFIKVRRVQICSKNPIGFLQMFSLISDNSENVLVCCTIKTEIGNR